MEREVNSKEALFKQLTAIHSHIIRKNNLVDDNIFQNDLDRILFSPHFMNGRQNPNLPVSELLLWLTVWRTGFELCDRFQAIAEWKLKHLFDVLKSYLLFPDKYVVYETQRLFVAVLKKKKLQFVMEHIASSLGNTSAETLGIAYSYAEICRDLLSRHNPNALPFFDSISQPLLNFISVLFQNRSHPKFYDSLYQLILIQIKIVKLIILHQFEKASQLIVKVLNIYGTKLVDILFDSIIQDGFIWKKACQMWLKVLSLFDVKGFESRRVILRRFALCFVDKMFQFGVLTLFPCVRAEKGRQLTLGFTGSKLSENRERASSDCVRLAEGCLLTIKACECLTVKPEDSQEAKISQEKSYSVLTALDNFIRETLSCDSKVSFHWLPQVFGDQDDSWIEVLLMLLNVAPQGQLPNLSPPVCVKHHHYFHQFIAATAYDHSILVDFLTSPETCFLAYFTKYLKYCLGSWEDFIAEQNYCDESHEVSKSEMYNMIEQKSCSSTDLNNARSALQEGKEDDSCLNTHKGSETAMLDHQCHTEDLKDNHCTVLKSLTESEEKAVALAHGEKRPLPVVGADKRVKKMKNNYPGRKASLHLNEGIQKETDKENCLNEHGKTEIDINSHTSVDHEMIDEELELVEFIEEEKSIETFKLMSQTDQESVLITESEEPDSAAVNYENIECQVDSDEEMLNIPKICARKADIQKEPHNCDCNEGRCSSGISLCVQGLKEDVKQRSPINRCNAEIDLEPGDDNSLLEEDYEAISDELDSVEFLEETKSNDTQRFEHAQNNSDCVLVAEEDLESLEFENVSQEAVLEVSKACDESNIILPQGSENISIITNLDQSDGVCNMSILDDTAVSLGQRCKNFPCDTHCTSKTKLTKLTPGFYNDNNPTECNKKYLGHAGSSEISTCAEIDKELENIEFVETPTQNEMVFKLVDYEIDDSESFSDSEYLPSTDSAFTNNHKSIANIESEDKTECLTDDLVYSFEDLSEKTAKQSGLVDFVEGEIDEEVVLNEIQSETENTFSSAASCCDPCLESKAFTEEDATCGRLDKLMAVLIRVRMKLEKLKSAGILQYNPQPLLRLLNALEQRYETS